jgi:hypothetical protein
VLDGEVIVEVRFEKNYGTEGFRLALILEICTILGVLSTSILELSKFFRRMVLNSVSSGKGNKAEGSASAFS